MSELLKREPFGMLLEDALSRYCMYRNNANNVTWIGKKPAFVKNVHAGQVWYANIYTNALFTKNCNPAAVEPLKREFSNSLIWWKVYLQKLYVHAAFTNLFSPILSQGTLLLSPGIINCFTTVVIPGNHKIRILEFDSNRCYSVMKRGYEDRKLSDEIMWREKAKSFNVPVPGIKEYCIDKMIMCEEIVVGTPLNRLKISGQGGYLSKAVRSIKVLADKTAESITVGQYVTDIGEKIEQLYSANTLIDRETVLQIQAIVGKINSSLASDTATEIAVAVTHGDFQPANILCSDETAWLIDWEYCGVRQKEFDLIVYDLQARAPAGLAQRMNARIAGCMDDKKKESPSLVVYTRTKLYLFILEELLIRIYENSFDFLTCIDTGIGLFVKEIESFLKDK